MFAVVLELRFDVAEHVLYFIVFWEFVPFLPVLEIFGALGEAALFDF